MLFRPLFDLCFWLLTASQDEWAQTATMQVWGNIEFVSYLFLMCVRTTRTKLVILVGYFWGFCSHNTPCINASYLSFSSSPKPGKFASPPVLNSKAAGLGTLNLSSTMSGCIGTKPSGRLGIKLSFHRTTLVVFTIWVSARD